ncbi:uncharacterized protein [Acropora muricata]|uniref:uncharacterized protein isoform X1 n=1 Tax=Acropora muricata TaxID=159855 RepID=UPI0034E570D9
MKVEQASFATGFQAHLFDSKLDTLTNSMSKMSDSLSRLAQTHGALLDSEEEDALREEGGQSKFDPTERILSQEINLESSELPYEDLFKDTEDCEPKVNEGVAKRVNSACTKRPTKEQFSSIQKKYLRPENCDFLKAPRVNPELWDDLQDKTRSRECSFQSFQKNLIKEVTPVVQLVSKVVDAKKSKEDSISFNDVYDLTVDALTLLGNSVYEFSMKRREMLKSEVTLTYKSLCHESQPITTMLFGDELPQSIRNISQVKRMAAKSIGHDRRRAISSSSAYTTFKNPRTNTSGSRRFGDHSRSNLNFKRHYEYRKPPYQRSRSSTRQPPKSSSTATKLQ